MKKRSTIFSALLATAFAVVATTALAVPASATAAPTSGCATVQTVVVRGTNEDTSADANWIAWAENPLADAITKNSPVTVSTVGIGYRGTDDYPVSVPEGVRMLTERLTKSAADCPDQKFVLFGNSQGAWVIGDALAGGNYNAQAISAELGKKIVAIVQFGDPRFDGSKSFDVGTYKKTVNGSNPRPAGNNLDAYSDRIASYCVFDDPVCQNVPTECGGFSTECGHSVYRNHYSDKAADFVVSHLPKTDSTGPGTPTPTPTTSTPAPSTETVITGLGSKCVDVDNRGTANRTQIQLYTCNSTPAQDWTLPGDGTVRALGKCMDVDGAGTGNGTRVQLYDCNGTVAQQWTSKADGTLVNPNSGRCLNVKGAFTTDKTPLIVWDCVGSANEEWDLAS